MAYLQPVAEFQTAFVCASSPVLLRISSLSSIRCHRRTASALETSVHTDHNQREAGRFHLLHGQMIFSP
jgi:hypothetical protein